MAGQGNAEPRPGAAREGFAKRLVLGSQRRVAVIREHWLMGLVYGGVIAVAGWVVGDLYDAWKPWGKDADAFLEKMKEDQGAAFASLEAGLKQIRGSIDSGDRAAFEQVSGAVDEMKSINTGLMSQLALAKQENDRLSKITQQQGGVSGGYDFILSRNTGMKLEPTTQIGIGSVSSSGARVRLSSDGALNQQVFLDAGEAIAYRSASGQDCKVTLLSVAGGSSASFALSCSGAATS